MASELTNCVIDIPSNIRARRMLIFRDLVTNVTEDHHRLSTPAIVIFVPRMHPRQRSLHTAYLNYENSAKILLISTT